MKIGLGGTFNILHKGHRALLDKAFEQGDEVVVGLTSDAMARRRKQTVVPLGQRRTALESYLRTKGANWSVVIIDSPQASLERSTEIGALVVSPETRKGGEAINQVRVSHGLVPLHLVVVPHVLADDFLPISSGRVMAGEIDGEGRLLRALRVVVGSTNPVKIAAVENVLGRFYSSLNVTGANVISGVPEQPREDLTRRGAMMRAAAAMDGADLSVGLEAGVFEKEDGLYDIQYCAVLDRRGRYTLGHGMGFRYPPGAADLIREGMTVGRAFKELYGPQRDGRGDGAIGYLTHGVLTRTMLAEQAVLAAMVPRVSKELYPDL